MSFWSPVVWPFVYLDETTEKGWQRIRRKTPKSKLSLKELLTTKVSDQQKDLQFTAFYEKAGKGTVT
jgi:hypothetical protein